MSRYVILEHDWDGVHYDLMFEQGERLLTWRLDSRLQPGVQSATKLQDHRKDYLTYEGLVSGNRGSVRRVAEGSFSVTASKSQEMILVLNGTYHGNLTLRQLAGDQWQLEWKAAPEPAGLS